MATCRGAGQTCFRLPLLKAGLCAEDIQYVEAHGTGTPVGDPIEAAALGAVLGNGRTGEACRIGTIKTNPATTFG